jgi:hypothetical protein
LSPADAFYIPDGDRFVSTDWTRGPWTPAAQHAGPPAALLARAIEGLDGGQDMQIAAFTAEILRPVPVTPLTVETRVIRPGRRVQYARALISDHDGEIIRAGAWRIRVDEVGSVPATEDEPPPFESPEDAPEPALPAFYEGPSYFTAMEWRFAGGSFSSPGPAAAWMRMRIPLVEGEGPSPATRVLVAADSGNGISNVLPLNEYVFINVDLSVHLFRMPAGQWVCLDAKTRVDHRGIGLAESRLWDERGRIGSGNQSLLVARR